ncbi:helix-turn-helix domain-containing protein [Nocardioides zeae]
MSKVPEPWATRMIERGFTDRRSTKSAVASFSALADELGVNTTTVSEAVTGRRTPTAATVTALMGALGDDVAGWLGFEHYGDWEPPKTAALLTPRQRRALEELIGSMTERVEQPTPRADVTLPDILNPTARRIAEMALADAEGDYLAAARRLEEEGLQPDTPRHMAAFELRLLSRDEQTFPVQKLLSHYLKQAGGDRDVAAALLRHDGVGDEDRAIAYHWLGGHFTDEGITSVAAYRDGHSNE